MSISIMTYAWRVPCPNNSAKLVLMKLADHASDDGVCWPSWGHLVKHTGLSRATVARALSELEKSGFVSRESRTGTSTMYTIHLDAIKKATPFEVRGHNSKGYQGETPIDPSRGETTPSQDETPTRLTVRPPPSHGETLTIREPSEETINETKERLLAIYLVWCSCSGGNMDKVQFAKAIKPLLPRYTDKELIQGVKNYFDLLEDKKYMSVRRFGETAAAYIKAKITRGIDPNSDMPPEEQAKYE